MLGITVQRERDDADVQQAESQRSIVATPLFKVARAVFGGVLAFMAIDNLRNLDERVQYAESQGAPFPEISVPAASTGLLLGGVGIALWRIPTAAAAAVAWFFASVTPVMHDFWNVEDAEQQQQHVFHFLKNTALLGAALAFLRLGRRTNESR